jgi:PBSX family phage portal protein
MADKPTTKAYVLKDGNVIAADYLQRYAVKGAESKQIPDDTFSSDYGPEQIIEPIYNLEALARLMEMNTYHYRAVKAKAHDTVGLGWRLIPVDGLEHPDGGQKEMVLSFFDNPHPELTLEEILSRWIEDYEATGNGYLELIRDYTKPIKTAYGNTYQLVGLEHIPSHTMRRHRDETLFVQKRGNKKRWFKRAGAPWEVDFETGEKGQLGKLEPDRRANEVLFIMNYSPRSDWYGIPDVMPALGALLGDKQREEFNIDFFENFAIPAYAVTIAGAELDETTEGVIKRFFQKDLKENRHSTLVITAANPMPDGPPIEIKFEKLAVDVQEASFRLYRQDNRDEILSAHGVPPYRAGIAEEGSLGGSTAVESTEIYKQSIINPRQRMIEARINKHILRDSFGVTDWVFQFEDIDTRDEERDTRIYTALFQMGAITANKIRELMGEERIDHPVMDTPFINGVPIDQIGGATQMERAEMLEAIKSLHKKLVDAVVIK